MNEARPFPILARPVLMYCAGCSATHGTETKTFQNLLLNGNYMCWCGCENEPTNCHDAEDPATPESVAREGEFYAHWLGVK